MTATTGTASRTRVRGGEDRHLQQRLGYWSLVATGIGSVIGSGWLFSAMYAAQTAGPAALAAWVIGGVVMLAVALVFAELGMVHPESGGLVRYPLYSNAPSRRASSAGACGSPTSPTRRRRRRGSCSTPAPTSPASSRATS